MTSKVNRYLYILYNSFLFLTIFITFPYIIYKLLKNKRYTWDLRKRLKPPNPNKTTNPIWVHASSVGEVMVASLLIKKIKGRWNNRQVILSVFTETGLSIAKNLVNDVFIFLLPIDMPWIMKKTVNNINPSIFIIIESEIWPNLLYTIKKKNIPIILVNGRISEKSYKIYRWVNFFLKWILSNITILSMRSITDSNRVKKLYFNKSKIFITGNLKYENVIQNIKECIPALERKKIFLPPNFRVIIFGCLRDGEETDLLPLFENLTKNYKNLVIIIAPRHLNRIKKIELLLKNKNLSSIKQSMIKDDSYLDASKIILVDILGNLSQLYSLATLAFVGGSLRKYGGHNILEPASHGKPVLFGNFMSNFQEEADELIKLKGAIQVNSPEDLQNKIFELLSNTELCEKMGKCAKIIFQINMGALGKNMALINKLLTG